MPCTTQKDSVELVNCAGEVVVINDKTEVSEISFYRGEIATKQEVFSELKKLKAAFQDVNDDFIIVLIDRLTANGFTKKRVQDAIGKIIDTCVYPKPRVADIISFDKRVKTYSYSEVATKCSQFKPAFESYERVEIDGKWRYIEK